MPVNIQANIQIMSNPQKILHFMQTRGILKLLKIKKTAPAKKKIDGPIYRFKYLQDFQIEFLKKEIGHNFYHLVVRYIIKTNKRKIGVIMTAHSYEKRLPGWRALKFLSQHGFSQGPWQAPKPLYYSKKLKAMFYREALGWNLRKLIRKKSKYIEQVIQESARWLAQLHILPSVSEMNFNKINSSIGAMTPGRRRGIAIIKKHALEFAPEVEAIWNKLTAQEKQNFKKLGRHYLIHGDFHPENIIFNKKYPKKITIIDFTDICLGDFTRDLGNFIEQLNFMGARDKIKHQQLEKWEKQFLAAYFKACHLKLTANLKNRIFLYRALAAFRTTIYYLSSGKYFNVKDAKTTLAITKKWLEKIK